MAKNNPINCVSLMIHEGNMLLFVHRGKKCNHYNFTNFSEHKSTKIRCERMTRIAAECSKVAYRNVTGELPPAK